MTIAALLTAITFGFRHGIDWDHIAAITDLTGSQRSMRRGMRLASMYAAGHALMILTLGVAAIVLAERLPDSVDSVMERVVGVTLIGLGAFLALVLIRSRGRATGSRWMMLHDAVRHRRRRGEPAGHAHDSGHHHRDDMSGSPYGLPSAFGIGMIHGIGAETPTQVGVFAAAAAATGRLSSLGILVFFIAGLLVANTVVAGSAAYGAGLVLDRRWIRVGLSSLTAMFSILTGVVFIAGHASWLPSILGG
ncbi:MAG: hypothetical protein JWL72_3101 [Ilumatobacteraceae bacterium]|nr:hypothetical protein [Ilumatobacteraceae bacterium]